MCAGDRNRCARDASALACSPGSPTRVQYAQPCGACRGLGRSDTDDALASAAVAAEAEPPKKCASPLFMRLRTPFPPWAAQAHAPCRPCRRKPGKLRRFAAKLGRSGKFKDAGKEEKKGRAAPAGAAVVPRTAAPAAAAATRPALQPQASVRRGDGAAGAAAPSALGPGRSQRLQVSRRAVQRCDAQAAHCLDIVTRPLPARRKRVRRQSVPSVPAALLSSTRRSPALAPARPRPRPRAPPAASLPAASLPAQDLGATATTSARIRLFEEGEFNLESDLGALSGGWVLWVLCGCSVGGAK